MTEQKMRAECECGKVVIVTFDDGATLVSAPCACGRDIPAARFSHYDGDITLGNGDTWHDYVSRDAPA